MMDPNNLKEKLVDNNDRLLNRIQQLMENVQSQLQQQLVQQQPQQELVQQQPQQELVQQQPQQELLQQQPQQELPQGQPQQQQNKTNNMSACRPRRSKWGVQKDKQRRRELENKAIFLVSLANEAAYVPQHTKNYKQQRQRQMDNVATFLQTLAKTVAYTPRYRD